MLVMSIVNSTADQLAIRKVQIAGSTMLTVPVWVPVTLEAVQTTWLPLLSTS
jgi:hypothetical protein